MDRLDPRVRPYAVFFRFKNFWYTALILSLVLAGCSLRGPRPTPQDLPDLTISNISLQMQGQENGGCVDVYAAYEVQAVLLNQGAVKAQEIVVEDHSGRQISIPELEPGKRTSVRFPAVAQDGRYTVQVDPQDLIAESDEDNNRLSFLASTPSPPPFCPTQPVSTPTTRAP